VRPAEPRRTSQLMSWSISRAPACRVTRRPRSGRRPCRGGSPRAG
jgi:hypothetical protein